MKKPTGFSGRWSFCLPNLQSRPLRSHLHYFHYFSLFLFTIARKTATSISVNTTPIALAIKYSILYPCGDILCGPVHTVSPCVLVLTIRQPIFRLKD